MREMVTGDTARPDPFLIADEHGREGQSRPERGATVEAGPDASR
jgi:hypothetical protein